jgi:hypothetical protein
MLQRSLPLFLLLGAAFGLSGCGENSNSLAISGKRQGAYVRFVNATTKQPAFFMDVHQVSPSVPPGMATTFTREAPKKQEIRAEVDGKVIAQMELDVSSGECYSVVLREDTGMSFETVTGEERLGKPGSAKALLRYVCVGDGPQALDLELPGSKLELAEGKAPLELDASAGSVNVPGAESLQVDLEPGVSYTIMLVAGKGKPMAMFLRNTPRDFNFTQASDGKAG